jgi:hypothetical protein
MHAPQILIVTARVCASNYCDGYLLLQLVGMGWKCLSNVIKCKMLRLFNEIWTRVINVLDKQLSMKINMRIFVLAYIKLEKFKS